MEEKNSNETLDVYNEIALSILLDMEKTKNFDVDEYINEKIENENK